MDHFNAILSADISFTDASGKPQTFPKGHSVIVTKVSTTFCSFSLSGQRQFEKSDTYYGTVGRDSFDLLPTEFSALQ